MSKPTTLPKRKLTNFELSDAARAALENIAAHHRWTKTTAVEQALIHFNADLAPLATVKKGGRK